MGFPRPLYDRRKGGPRALVRVPQPHGRGEHRTHRGHHVAAHGDRRLEIGLPKNISLLHGVSQFTVSLIKLTVRGRLAYRQNNRLTLAIPQGYS
jgi:hypothetical protein